MLAFAVQCAKLAHLTTVVKGDGMRAITYSFWALVITVALLTTGIIKLMTDDPTPPPLADTCPESMICYEPYGAPVEPEYILDGSIVLVRFVDASTLPDGLEAYAEYVADFDANISFCVITTVMPQQMLGDPAMDALGHEMLHCLTGAFHP